MHFAYPPRKSSNPPPFRLRPSNLPLRRRPRLRTVLVVLFTLLFGIFLLSRRGSGPDPYHEHAPTGNPPVVIVTVVDPSKFSGSYIKSIKENREQYARKHGYETHIPNVDDYDLVSHHKSWSKIMAMRHALTKYPDCKFIWYLDQDAYIMDPTKSLTSDLLDSKTLGGLMIKDYPIVPPDSIIKSFAHLKSDDARLVVSQDRDGLVSNSIFLRNGDWAKFLTETWLDPLYRSYNFQKAERHALEHMVQWHPTILSKIALIPQRLIASYTRANLGAEYREGDFVVMFYGCTVDGERSCDSESQLYRQKWQTAFQAS